MFLLLALLINFGKRVCDWCRLLYTYRDSLNYGLLEQRIKSAGLMREWKAFGALAIEYLGFPAVLPKDYVQWGEKCNERGIIFLS